MQIHTNAMGDRRKVLVGILNEHLTGRGQPHEVTSTGVGANHRYTVGEYTVNRLGTITGPDDLEMLEILEASEEGYGDCAFELDNPSLLNPEQAQPDTKLPSEALPPVVAIPHDQMTAEQIRMAQDICTAKAGLLKIALARDDFTVIDDGTDWVFNWFPAGTTQEEAKLYAQFISALCETARYKQRVYIPPYKDWVHEPTAKYEMRNWLLSIGMKGQAFAEARRFMLRNFPGSSSFWQVKAKTYTAFCYIYPNGSEEDEMVCEEEDFKSLAKAKRCCDAFVQETPGAMFAGCHVEDDTSKVVYEIPYDG
jgi:hypothetical protein